jgi:hypothetical protein
MKEEKNLHKGHYGHLKRYKQIRLLIIFVCFLFILTDVVFSLIVFQTRRSLFIVMAAIMSIPFAKNFVSYLLSLKCKPLNKKEYEKTVEMSEKYSLDLLYDISVTDDDVKFFPAAAIVNNSLVAYRPETSDTLDKKKSTEYLENVFADFKDKVRIYIVNDLDHFDKELKRLTAASKEVTQSRNIRFKLLDAGF